MRIAEAGSDLEIHASDFLGSRYVMLVVWLCSSREWCFRAIPLGTPKIHDSIAGLSRLKGCLIRFSLSIINESIQNFRLLPTTLIFVHRIHQDRQVLERFGFSTFKSKAS
jgi:hypothetical protein